LNVLDEGNREALAIEISPSLPSPRVVRLLEQLVAVQGPPTALRCENGPELIAEAPTSWCEAQGIALQHIAPGKPNQNAFIERFNRTYRDGVLNAWVFTSLTEVRQVTEDWLTIYNTERPHDSLGGVPPGSLRLGRYPLFNRHGCPIFNRHLQPLLCEGGSPRADAARTGPRP
jgi:putative transposase